MPKDTTIGPHEREAFGLRLKIAARARGLTTKDVIGKIRDRVGLSEAGFHKHWAGASMARGEKLQAYSDILDVTADWLTSGGGEDIDILRSAVVAMEAGENKNPDLIFIQKQIGVNTDDRGAVNQLSQDSGTNSSKTLEICHIPVLAGDELAAYVFGNGSVNIMTAHFVPVLKRDGLGPRAVAHEFTVGDLSMVSPTERSFPPGTILVFDPARAIAPGDFILVRLKGDEAWMCRRYKAALAFGKAKAFTLEALNPSFEPIRVNDPSKWEVAGRAVKIVSDL